MIHDICRILFRFISRLYKKSSTERKRAWRKFLKKCMKKLEYVWFLGTNGGNKSYGVR